MYDKEVLLRVLCPMGKNTHSSTKKLVDMRLGRIFWSWVASLSVGIHGLRSKSKRKIGSEEVKVENRSEDLKGGIGTSMKMMIGGSNV